MKQRLSALAPLLLLSACATTAGEGSSPEAPAVEPGSPQAVADLLVRTALSERGTWRLLNELCTVAPHRLSGSAGAARAVTWAHDAMVAAGLENVRLEPCTVPRWERGDTEDCRWTNAEGGERELPILALGGSIATPPGGIEAEVIAVQDFEELKALGEDRVRGRIVLFARPMEDANVSTFRSYGGAVGQRSQGPAEAASYGAVATLVRSMTLRRDDVPHTGATRYRPGIPKIPAAAIATRPADEIVRALEAGSRVRVRLELSCRTLEPVLSYNVVGELVGRELPDEIVVVGGHLDAWDVGQGAHDDGAGCTQSIEALRLLKELDLRPRRTLRAVLFMNEENGLAGGRAYREAHLGELDKHVLAIESDSGGFTPRGFSSNAGPEAMELLREAAGLLAGIGADKVVPGGGGADIGPMGQDGVVLVGYLPDSQRYFDVHHSPADTLEAVSPRELELGTAAMATLAWWAGERSEVLPRNPVK